ncbi:MAG: acetate/propionate family kinase [Planctomycetota bacterium]|nr:acetate/propionate family kinase [Planctomycetota bacterium]
MKILVSNIGSTSFKFRLFEMGEGFECELASGSVDRIGAGGGTVSFRLGGGEVSQQHNYADHGEAIRSVLAKLSEEGAPGETCELDAVAFKAVMAGDYEPVALVDDELLEQMEYFCPVAPAHNPAYISAMRMFRDVLPSTPLVAAFEPGFHRTIPDRRRYYAVPLEWAEDYGVKRYGFHGASHRYIATRTAELMGPENARRIISCHLGGSSSICAIRDGESVATSFGLSPQSGLPQVNRSGEFDPFAFSLLKERAGMDAETVLAELGKSAGLAALSKTSGDMRDIREAADAGNEHAKLAMEIFITAVRDYVGAYLVELGGADALVFTGGIGLNHPPIRRDVCKGMEFIGIVLDEDRNAGASGETRIDASKSATAVWSMPTNEEIIVARQAAELLKQQTNSD